MVPSDDDTGQVPISLNYLISIYGAYMDTRNFITICISFFSDVLK